MRSTHLLFVLFSIFFSGYALASETDSSQSETKQAPVNELLTENVTDSENVIQDSNAKSNENILEHLTALAADSISNFKQTGLASWYDQQQNQQLDSKDAFNVLTAAHKTLKVGSYVKVTNQDNGKSVVVKITDRQDTKKSILDLSYEAAKKIGMVHQTLGKVIIEKVTSPN